MPRRKKTFIQVAGNPVYQPPPNPNATITNPLTGTPEFGVFPRIEAGGRVFEQGLIYLRHGKHFGPNRGFGLEHIWTEHFSQHQSAQEALPDVAALINGVLVSGATIHYEYRNGKDGDRTTILKSAVGIVIVEARTDGLNRSYYVIVTAFAGTKAYGPIIGAVA